jgi:hypothetical protein
LPGLETEISEIIATIALASSFVSLKAFGRRRRNREPERGLRENGQSVPPSKPAKIHRVFAKVIQRGRRLGGLFVLPGKSCGPFHSLSAPRSREKRRMDGGVSHK